ncbi:hypothetical protein BC937DRAFT_90589 [Endogone sp. FLAS-F59071]|nr:hypothetical protein BC937DRAFT_90589 [Endogone sp. FLAS-F59071]|eukprot:RUS22037.1 hypothetical protein BC937DRAFT_90589 [Endogone sp. FLAS-F59071]
MDQETANALFARGAVLLFFDAPAKLEFGIDCSAWTIGPLFKGIKMIPPGLHFVYYSTTSKEGTSGLRMGFFKFFESQEIVVKKWDLEIEDLRDGSELDPDQVERYKLNIRSFDPNLGAYPLHPPTIYQKWQRLTDKITPLLLSRVLPQGGRVSHLPDRGGEDTDREEGVAFAAFDLRKSFPPGAAGVEVTRWSLDKSWLLGKMMDGVWGSDPKNALGELQLAFACLLFAQNFSGLEAWKRTVGLLCGCKEALVERTELFVEFTNVLQTQLEECPPDFFHDILSENNFLTHELKTFSRNIPRTTPRLRARFESLRMFVKRRFDWDIGGEARAEEEDEEDEDGEYAPVVVEM